MCQGGWCRKMPLLFIFSTVCQSLSSNTRKCFSLKAQVSSSYVLFHIHFTSNIFSRYSTIHPGRSLLLDRIVVSCTNIRYLASKHVLLNQLCTNITLQGSQLQEVIEMKRAGRWASSRKMPSNKDIVAPFHHSNFYRALPVGLDCCCNLHFNRHLLRRYSTKVCHLKNNLRSRSEIILFTPKPVVLTRIHVANAFRNHFWFLLLLYWFAANCLFERAKWTLVYSNQSLNTNRLRFRTRPFDKMLWMRISCDFKRHFTATRHRHLLIPICSLLDSNCLIFFVKKTTNAHDLTAFWRWSRLVLLMSWLIFLTLVWTGIMQLCQIKKERCSTLDAFCFVRKTLRLLSTLSLRFRDRKATSAAITFRWIFWQTSTSTSWKMNWSLRLETQIAFHPITHDFFKNVRNEMKCQSHISLPWAANWMHSKSIWCDASVYAFAEPNLKMRAARFFAFCGRWALAVHLKMFATFDCLGKHTATMRAPISENLSVNDTRIQLCMLVP